MPQVIKRKDPYLQSEKVTATNLSTVAQWCGGTVDAGSGTVRVPTVGGLGTAGVGDYVVKLAGENNFVALPPAMYGEMFEDVK